MVLPSISILKIMLSEVKSACRSEGMRVMVLMLTVYLPGITLFRIALSESLKLKLRPLDGERVKECM